MGRPITVTSPPLAASRPPSRCSSVLLPEPEAPTIATHSPPATVRSTPSSTGTSTFPCKYVLRRPRHISAGPCICSSPFTLHPSLFTLHSSPFTLHHSPFTFYSYL